MNVEHSEGGMHAGRSFSVCFSGEARSPMSMETMPMFSYPGTSSTPYYSNMSQYPYYNPRIPPTLDNNYIQCRPTTRSFRVIHLLR